MQFSGPARVANNGNGSDLSGGVIVNGGSFTALSGNGVAVVNGGIAQFAAGVNVPGNGAKDLFCDDRSLITGGASVAGATKVQCTQLIPGSTPPLPHS